jgi:ubiquinol oxidase
VKSAVLVIDKLYEGRDYPRFYALETVARVPYFSFLSVLHLYETLGFWRRADYLKVHFAQTMNEFHHLLIMEAMGGDKKFADRFFAQHMAVAYYGMTCLVYLASPRMAYNLSEQVEAHAYHTYDEFLKRNEAELKASKPPAIARKYYAEGDLFLFDEFQTGDPTAKSAACAERRRPVIENLYDVFLNVRNDEAEHMKTMQFCQLPGTILRAPSESACVVGDGESKNAQSASNDDDDDDDDDDGTDATRTCEGLVDCVIRAQDEPTWQAERDGGEEP